MLVLGSSTGSPAQAGLCLPRDWSGGAHHLLALPPVSWARPPALVLQMPPQACRQRRGRCGACRLHLCSARRRPALLPQQPQRPASVNQHRPGLLGALLLFIEGPQRAVVIQIGFSMSSVHRRKPQPVLSSLCRSTILWFRLPMRWTAATPISSLQWALGSQEVRGAHHLFCSLCVPVLEIARV